MFQIPLLAILSMGFPLAILLVIATFHSTRAAGRRRRKQLIALALLLGPLVGYLAAEIVVVVEHMPAMDRPFMIRALVILGTIAGLLTAPLIWIFADHRPSSRS